MSRECRKVVDAIASGSSLELSVAGEHPADCAECAERIALATRFGFGGAPDSETRPAALLEELNAGLRTQQNVLGSWRSRASYVRAAVLAVLAVGLILSQWFNARVDLSVYPVDRMVLSLGAFALPVLLAWGLVFRGLQRAPLPRGALWAFAALAIGAQVVLAALPDVHTGHAASVGGTGAELIPRALACFIYGAVFGLPVIGVAVASMRTGARLAGLLLVVVIAAASLSNAVLQLHCPLTHPSHLLLGHASIGIFFALGAAAWIALRR